MMKEQSADSLFEVLCGTYEEYLLGYKLIKEENGYKLEHSIADHSHLGSVRSLATHQRHLASGGSDENIYLYDLKERREGGLLMHHCGMITTLKFTPDGTHLMSGSEDGAIAMVRVGNWILEKIWTKAHKGMAVHSISIHPSGKMALSVGADKTLRTWNLIKGRPAYTVNLANKCLRPEIISWSFCGNYFALVNQNSLVIYDVSSAAVQTTITIKDRITCVEFLKGERVCLGDWAGNVTCYAFLTGEEQWQIPRTDEVRVKTIGHINDWLVVANGQGKLMVYDVKNKPDKLTEINTMCRITCMTISRIDESKMTMKKKKKKKNDEVKVKSEGDILVTSGQKWIVSSLS
ncbi:p21-activated protein kinase-interacting protein 1-like [Cimex lectularius]|uniref:P21-activated protein kinase-interacting protein 1-like n=1 Tax=Cimex lectularius TaxID=79782 RepID=A0A8I6RFY5_CIMLE|nr:p21-activated protein kinase-interacting protein 1-like [Cimex lectularius]